MNKQKIADAQIEVSIASFLANVQCNPSLQKYFNSKNDYSDAEIHKYIVRALQDLCLAMPKGFCFRFDGGLS